MPKKLVEKLGLKAGDDIDIVAAVHRRIEVRKDDTRDRGLRDLAELEWVLPKDYRFDRAEANER